MSAHYHDDDRNDRSELSPMQVRVRALETILTEKGYVDPAALDLIVEAYESKVGPHIGARIVARAWNDLDFKQRLLADSDAAIAALVDDLRPPGGVGLKASYNLSVVANDVGIHNMVVCTLCSCYPWSILGLPPVWYKSAPYRSRVVKDPRGVLQDFGVELPAGTEIRVWDSTAQQRYLVLPVRPAGTDTWTDDKLAGLVTRDCMIGTGLAGTPEDKS